MTIINERLYTQGLIDSSFESTYDVVKQLGCMQAQDLHRATRAIGSRAPGITRDDVLEALRDGSIVRTRPMRGTLHVMLPEDVHRMMDLCASKILASFKERRTYLGISNKHADRALELLDTMLRGKHAMTRQEIIEQWKSGGIPVTGQRGYHLLNFAATQKLICFGPPRGSKDTFVLLDERVANPKTPNHDEALAMLARMFFSGHGPATVADLARRSGVGKTDIKRGIALIEDELHQREWEGETFYSAVRGKKTPTPKRSVILLAGFDEYFIGYKDRSLIAQSDLTNTYYSRNGIFWPLILVDGFVVGKWKRTLLKNKVRITYEIADTSKKVTEKELEHAATQYAQFVGRQEVELIKG